MGRGEPGGGEERVRHKGELSLRKRGWGDDLMSGVREESKVKQGILYLTRVKLCP